MRKTRTTALSSQQTTVPLQVPEEPTPTTVIGEHWTPRRTSRPSMTMPRRPKRALPEALLACISFEYRSHIFIISPTLTGMTCSQHCASPVVQVLTEVGVVAGAVTVMVLVTVGVALVVVSQGVATARRAMEEATKAEVKARENILLKARTTERCWKS